MAVLLKGECSVLHDISYSKTLENHSQEMNALPICRDYISHGYKTDSQDFDRLLRWKGLAIFT